MPSFHSISFPLSSNWLILVNWYPDSHPQCWLQEKSFHNSFCSSLPTHFTIGSKHTFTPVCRNHILAFCTSTFRYSTFHKVLEHVIWQVFQVRDISRSLYQATLAVTGISKLFYPLPNTKFQLTSQTVDGTKISISFSGQHIPCTIGGSPNKTPFSQFWNLGVTEVVSLMAYNYLCILTRPILFAYNFLEHFPLCIRTPDLLDYIFMT